MISNLTILVIAVVITCVSFSLWLILSNKKTTSSTTQSGGNNNKPVPGGGDTPGKPVGPTPGKPVGPVGPTPFTPKFSKEQIIKTINQILLLPTSTPVTLNSDQWAIVKTALENPHNPSNPKNKDIDYIDLDLSNIVSGTASAPTEAQCSYLIVLGLALDRANMPRPTLDVWYPKFLKVSPVYSSKICKCFLLSTPGYAVLAGVILAMIGYLVDSKTQIYTPGIDKFFISKSDMKSYIKLVIIFLIVITHVFPVMLMIIRQQTSLTHRTCRSLQFQLAFQTQRVATICEPDTLVITDNTLHTTK